MKARIILFGTVATNEPRIEECFIRGYESGGASWSDNINNSLEVSENISTTQGMTDTLDLAIANGETMIMRNTGNFNLVNLQSYHDNNDMVFLCGAASTSSTLQNTDYHFPILCGAGVDRNMHYDNESIIEPMFYSIDPVARANEVASVVQHSPTVTRLTVANFIDWDTFKPRVLIKNVFGFENNPNGLYPVVLVTSYSIVDIEHVLGAGSYNSQGTMETHYMSYTAPYIGGKMSWLKDIGYTWDEALTILRYTCVQSEEFLYCEGHGRMLDNTSHALERYLSRPPMKAEDLNQVELQVGSSPATRSAESLTNQYSIYFRRIPKAEYYEFYLNGDLYWRVRANDLYNSQVVFTAIPTRPSDYKYAMTYKAFAEGVSSKHSNPLMFRNTSLKRIRIS